MPIFLTVNLNFSLQSKWFFCSTNVKLTSPYFSQLDSTHSQSYWWNPWLSQAMQFICWRDSISKTTNCFNSFVVKVLCNFGLSVLFFKAHQSHSNIVQVCDETELDPFNCKAIEDSSCRHDYFFFATEMFHRCSGTELRLSWMVYGKNFHNSDLKQWFRL